MSTGIDKQFVLEFYQRMSNEELINVLENDVKGLTTEAQEIVNSEVKKRRLNPQILKVVAAQQEVYTHVPRAYNSAGPPVEEDVRLWLEESFVFLLNLFGIEETKTRRVLTPEQVHFPIRYDGSEASAFATLKIVAAQMEVSYENIILDFYDEDLQQITEGTPGGLYWGKAENEKFEISLVRTLLNEPLKMVATLAHEIAHIKLLGENKMEENDERLTDLVPAFFGLGLFNANAAFETFSYRRYQGWSTLGYLNQMEWGYALALFAYLRKETDPTWANYLCTNVKADFRQGQEYIINNPGEISLEIGNDFIKD